MVILIYFLFLFFFFYRLKSVVSFLILLQLVSLLGMFFIGQYYAINSFFKLFNVILTIFILSLIIFPWKYFSHIQEISYSNAIKLKRVTQFLIAISVIPFITFLVTSFFVLFFVEDINTFKYAEGVSDDFYYNLPFDVRAIILSSYIYGFSYFLIPLHFYYLSKRNYRLSFLCFLFSLNIVLYGLTYFSRSVFVHYGFIYISFLIILYGTLDKKIKIYIKYVMSVLMSLMIAYFVSISFKRFGADTLYAETIPSSSFIQDQVLYSYFDYLSQWYNNNMDLLNAYSFKIFNGQISFQSLLSLLGNYGLINYDTNAYSALRQQLWPLHWYTFNGFVAYIIYDFGYILTMLFSFYYYFVVYYLRPKKNQISLLSLFLLVLLIQIPLLAIFYSALGGIIIPLLLLIPIFIYMKVSFNSNNSNQLIDPN